MLTTQTACRISGEADLIPVLSLGLTPLADVLLSKDAQARTGPTYPLTLAFSPSSGLVQLLETVSRDQLFNDGYPYYSGVSSTLERHFKDSAESLIDRLALDSGSFVVEAASNDGCMLKHFVRRDIPALGIDPSAGPVRAARDAGVPSLLAFFDSSLAEEVVREYGHADVFLANNVLAHVCDPGDFVAGIARVLSDEGVAVIEVPYIVDLVENCEFDTIYHQHLCYFSLTSLKHLFDLHGLTIASVKRITIHGGSLRVTVRRQPDQDAGVSELLNRERAEGVDTLDYYQRFADRVQKTAMALQALLLKLKREGAKLAGFGAAAKANTLLAYTKIDGRVLDYVVDSNTAKQGLFMGNGLPIVDEGYLRAHRPDYLVLLAWNFAAEIKAQLAWYQEEGGRFVLPIPHPRVCD